MPNPVTAPTATSPVAYPGAATAATDTKGPDKDMFLKLMVAQLRFQNPLEPTDQAQFMAQTAQFTMVETLQTLSQSQDASLRWIRMSAAQGMLGQQVTTTDPVTGLESTGEVTGVRATADGPMLTIVPATGDPVEVPMDNVTAVTATRRPEPTPTA